MPLSLTHPASLFPPTSASDTYILLVEILTCDAPDKLKQSLVYYLGLEHQALEPRAMTDPHSVTGLVSYIHASSGTCSETQAYWAVDHGHLQQAVLAGRHARFVSVLAEVLVSSPASLLQLYDVQGSLPPLDGKPTEASLQDLVRITVALAHVEGLASAWNACRVILEGQPAEYAPILREHMFGTLLRLCFAPPQAPFIRELLMLPLYTVEERFWETMALSTMKKNDAAISLDTLLIKWVNQGRYVDAIHLDRRASQLERTMAFSDSDSEAFQRTRHRRRALLDGLWAILPKVQRDALLARDIRPEDSQEDSDMDVQSPPPRPHTPLSASLSSKTMSEAIPSSPDIQLLRASIRVPSVTSSRDSSQRHASPQVVRMEQSPVPHNSSPFSGWKRPGPSAQPPPSSYVPRASWGVPVPPPAVNAEDAAMDERSTENEAPRVSETAVSETEPMEEMQDDVPVSALADEHMESEEPPVEAPVRRRGGRRRAAQKATEALRKTLRPEDAHPSLPGSFPMDEEAPSAPPSEPSRAKTRRSARRSTRKGPDATSDEVGESDAAVPPARSRRASTADASAYPQKSLARLQALHDHRPIARRTRAQTAELESHGSQASTEAGEGDEASELESEVAPTPSRPRRKTREPTSPAAATPQRGTRTSRRRREGSLAAATGSRTTRRGGASHAE